MTTRSPSLGRWAEPGPLPSFELEGRHQRKVILTQTSLILFVGEENTPGENYSFHSFAKMRWSNMLKVCSSCKRVEMKRWVTDCDLSFERARASVSASLGSLEEFRANVKLLPENKFHHCVCAFFFFQKKSFFLAVNHCLVFHCASFSKSRPVRHNVLFVDCANRAVLIY